MIFKRFTLLMFVICFVLSACGHVTAQPSAQPAQIQPPAEPSEAAGSAQTAAPAPLRPSEVAQQGATTVSPIATPSIFPTPEPPLATPTTAPTAEAAGQQGADTEAPVWGHRGANLGARDRTATTMTLAWEPANDNVGVVAYEIYEGRWSASATSVLIGTAPTSLYTVTGLASTKTYEFYVRAVDAAGNRSIPSIVLMLRTADDQPPGAPDGLEVLMEYSTSESLYLRWINSTDNLTLTHYEVYLDGQLYLTPVYAGDGETTATVEGLQVGTSYAISVVAVDIDGNRSGSSETIQATTPDTTPPSEVGNVRVVEQSDTSVTIAWEPATDNVGVAEYVIYGSNDVLLATTSETTYTITGLKAGDYVVVGSVRARDEAGNESFFSMTFSAWPQ